jgi:hypothetical protein
MVVFQAKRVRTRRSAFHVDVSSMVAAETGGRNRFDLPFDKKGLASSVDLAPEVLSRSFAALVPQARCFCRRNRLVLAY